jgi:uncharacterized MAPEG superfamily protein
MSKSELALVAYASWFLTLIIAIEIVRSYLTVFGGRRANSFSQSGEDISPLVGRLCRAHANCYENLPVFVLIMLLSFTLSHFRITDSLAIWFVAARFCQSLAHLFSVGQRIVQVRFAFFMSQIACEVYWIFLIIGAYAPV